MVVCKWHVLVYHLRFGGDTAGVCRHYRYRACDFLECYMAHIGAVYRCCGTMYQSHLQGLTLNHSFSRFTSGLFCANRLMGSLPCCCLKSESPVRVSYNPQNTIQEVLYKFTEQFQKHMFQIGQQLTNMWKVFRQRVLSYSAREHSNACLLRSCKTYLIHRLHSTYIVKEDKVLGTGTFTGA
jgi:hypothetical protein